MLLVIAIIAILAGIVIVAINPGRQLAQARNAERQSDLKAIFEATQQYYIKNRTWPSDDLSSSLYEICDTGSETTGHSVDCEGKIDLSALVPDYLTAIPSDPLSGAIYAIAKSTNNRLSLTAPSSTEYSLDLVAIGTTSASATTIPPACSGECATISESLIAYYTFDNDTLPTAIDEMGSHNGTYSGNAQPTSSCGDSENGSCATFDGSGDWITVVHHENLEPDNLTVSFWGKYNSISDYKGFFSKTTTTGNRDGYQNFYANSRHQFTVDQATDQPAPPAAFTSFSSGTWYHIVMTYDGTTTRLYKNGVYADSEVETRTETAYPLKIGAGIGAEEAGRSINGQVDEFMIFNTTLSADDILYIYNNQEMFKL